MATIHNETAITGEAYTPLFAAATDGGPVRALRISVPSDSAAGVYFFVAPVQTLSSETPADEAEGVYIAPGGSELIVGVVGGAGSINAAWAKPADDTAATVNLAVVGR